MSRSLVTGALGAATLFLSGSWLASPAWAGGCNWIDGPDPKAPANDPMRGRLEGNLHREFALTAEGRKAGPPLIGSRLQALFGCLDRAAYAKAYADSSVLTATFGRRYAGWKDGADPKAPPSDSGRGISDYQAHQNHALGPMGPTAGNLLAARLASLVPLLKPSEFADLYTPLTLQLARSGGSMPAAPPPPPPPPSPSPAGPVGKNENGPTIYHCQPIGGWAEEKGAQPLTVDYQAALRPEDFSTLTGSFVTAEGTGRIDGKVQKDIWNVTLSVLSADGKSGWRRALTGQGRIDPNSLRLYVTGSMVTTRIINGQQAPLPAKGSFSLNGNCTR